MQVPFSDTKHLELDELLGLRKNAIDNQLNTMSIDPLDDDLNKIDPEEVTKF